MDRSFPVSRRPRLLGLMTVIAVATLGAVVTVSQALAAPPTYTALGDSYASGVGTRTYYSDGTNCKRSPDAYPVLSANQKGLTLTFAACSGAKVADVLNTQLASLTPATTDVTVEVGGNDAGFSSVLQTCDLGSNADCDAAIANANAYITGTLPGTLDTLYAKIRSLATRARVVVVGYPRIFNGQECNLIIPSAAEQPKLNQTADLLDTTIAGRASAHRFSFVDPRAAFTGHAICDPVEWVNGLSNPVSESYHPNVSGQAGYASLVEPVLA
jgi:lysophospholipase L1-like esterase